MSSLVLVAVYCIFQKQFFYTGNGSGDARSSLGNSAEQKWGQAQNYHIALDSGKLGIEKCVELLAGLYHTDK